MSDQKVDKEIVEEIVEESVELDEKAVTTIVKKTSEAVMPKLQEGLDEAIDKSVKDAVEAGTQEVLDKYLEKTEDIEKKAVEKANADAIAKDPIATAIANKKFSEEITKMSPAMRFYRQVRALARDEIGSELKELNTYGITSQIKARQEAETKGMDVVAKVGYNNETTAADGAVLVPDADFITTVFDNLPNYGVAFQYADVRQTDRTSVRVISIDSGLTFYATAEAGVKTAAKLQFSKNEVTLQKYAVIVPATDELTEDAAIDFWNLVTRELSRGYALKADEVTFTDAAGSASGSGGITNQTGVLTHTCGVALTWDDLLTAQSKTEDDLDESNSKWFMRKETWYALVQTKGTTNDHYIAGSLNTATGWVANPNQPVTPWGTPVVFTRVLPTINSVSANDAIAVYGDLKNYLLFNKRGMQLKMLTEAAIVDQAGASTNLATQDITAMRAVVRMLGILPKGNRTKFVVLGSGTVS